MMVGETQIYSKRTRNQVGWKKYNFVWYKLIRHIRNEWNNVKVVKGLKRDHV